MRSDASDPPLHSPFDIAAPRSATLLDVSPPVVVIACCNCERPLPFVVGGALIVEAGHCACGEAWFAWPLGTDGGGADDEDDAT